jgi:dolichol-phosphate mannosyltransferase
MSRQKQAEWSRWGVFNLVGILGFALQMGVLLLLKHCFGVGYLIATVLAVEITVLHNFVWHEHVTWVDVVAPFRHGVYGRLVRFQVANGILSIAGNVAITWALVESFRAPYLLANAASVLICAVLNFIAADRFVFRSECRREIRLVWPKL